MRDGLLPKTVKPLNYNLTIEPDLHALTFIGRVAIELIVLQATDKITLHSLGLDLSEVSLKVGDQIPASPINIDQCTETETVTFSFARTLAAKTGALLHIQFSGVLQDGVAGFYRARYKGRDGAQKHACVTQFQATGRVASVMIFMFFGDADRVIQMHDELCLVSMSLH